MDRVDTEGDAAERALLSTGSLASGAAHRTRRPRTVVLVLSCVALLAGGFLVQHLTGHRGAAPSARQTSVSATRGVTVTGRRAFVVHSGSATAEVVLGSAARVPTGPSGSALEVALRLYVSAGAETVTTETFAASGPDGAAARPASAVTVLNPDSRVEPSNGGFRIAAPDSVHLVVILAVPPGDDTVSVLDDAADRTLASFAVHG